MTALVSTPGEVAGVVIIIGGFIWLAIAAAKIKTDDSRRRFKE